MATDEELISRIQTAKQKVQDRTQARMRLEARMESFQADLEQFKVRLKDQGIDPSKLGELIEDARQDLEAKLTALETALDAS